MGGSIFFFVESKSFEFSIEEGRRWYVLPTAYLRERQRLSKINIYGKRKCKETAVQCGRTDL